MDIYKCTVCGYIYDPRRGDPLGDIEAETEFDELPEDWICPKCGADFEAFGLIED